MTRFSLVMRRGGNGTSVDRSAQMTSTTTQEQMYPKETLAARKRRVAATVHEISNFSITELQPEMNPTHMNSFR